MVVVRKWGEKHIRNSLKQIDSNTWLIGPLLLHRIPHPSDTATWNDDGDSSSYLLTKAPSPFPSAVTLFDSPHIKLVHEAGDASAVWSIGYNAFCKVRYIQGGVTPESVTLNFVQEQKPSFQTPEVLHHAFDDDRSYLFLRRVPGRTLDAAWPSLDEYWRHFYVDAVVGVCKEMAEWRGRRFGGVDGQNIPEYYLIGPGAPEDFSSANMRATCEKLGMNCSTFVFYHADLGPTNIIVENVPMSGKIAIVDFEISGFFPRSWIRTKFRLSSGMDLSPSASDDPYWWRREVQGALGASGFDDVRLAWEQWQEYKSPLDQSKN